jgi:hypothetical protein
MKMDTSESSFNKNEDSTAILHQNEWSSSFIIDHAFNNDYVVNSNNIAALAPQNMNELELSNGNMVRLYSQKKQKQFATFKLIKPVH